MGSTEDTWKKFCAKSLYEQLTENLFIEACNDAQGKDNVFYYLEDKNNRNLLDKCFCAVSSYKGYKIYKDPSFIIRKNGNDGYYDFTVFAGRRVTFRLENEDIKLSGEDLNNSTPILEKYKTDIGDNGDKKKFSELSKMFFHLVTTVGNVMPWPMYYGYRPVNKELDIAQTKYQYYIGLYGRVNNTGIDKKSWIKAFVEGHYLQDFVTDDMEKALEFLNLDKVYKLKDDNALQNWVENIAGKKGSVGDDVEKVWDIYFYRASKAIMKRSYRILKEIDGDFSPEQKKEFNEKFQEFCEEYKVKQELEKLKEYLDKHEDEKIKCNETDELKALIDKL